MRKPSAMSIQTDGYIAYQEIGHTNGLTMLGCMAHARRYFEQALDHDKARATVALAHIQKLYVIERVCREQKFAPDEVYHKRQEEAVVSELKIFLILTLLCQLTKSRCAKFIWVRY